MVLPGKRFELEHAYSPPPYEASAAYPRIRPRALRRLLSVLVLLAVSLSAAVAWFCFLQRGTFLDDAATPASAVALRRFEESLRHCAALKTFPLSPDPRTRKTNSRWNSARGQAKPVVLRNTTLFDGESILPEPMDIKFVNGLVTELAPTSSERINSHGAVEHNLNGRFVTPGLVDMHSHHSIGVWPTLPSNDDVNELNPGFGPLTPFVRALDSMKAYDQATTAIMSGGVTSSLILPGSANIMGGEGTVVKNVLKSGPLGEFVVEELLLERGIPISQRHRYMKLACGENPKRFWEHTRMGDAWLLREQFARAKQLVLRQDEYCEAAAAVYAASGNARLRFLEQMGSFPSDLKLESTAGMLRGRVAMQNHCYLPEDMETMLRVTREFGVKVRAFHHAIEAWQVPEMLKAYGDNVTIATFAELSLYKWESYSPSLAAGKILNAHGIPIAYKSDHYDAEASAKYIMYQAGVGHAFHLPEEKALQAVTSVPAKAIDLGYRTGYARPGYDADLVVWDAHPLAIGATPLQVFVDGIAQLESKVVKESLGETFVDAPKTKPVAPKMRAEVDAKARALFCQNAKKADSFIINGITKSFLKTGTQRTAFRGNLTLVVSDGAIACLDTAERCASAVRLVSHDEATLTMHMSDGYILPGLTALTASLGMAEISMEPDTGDGFANPAADGSNPDNLAYAKYGVQLEGKTFARARMGGVTRAITPPLSLGGLVNGVSVGILTESGRTLLDGGVFKSEVALHVTIDSGSKVSEGTVSAAVNKLRKILASGKGKYNETIFGDVAAGRTPLLVYANNHWDIQQVIHIQKEFPDVNVVIVGGAEAPLVAKELAKSNIPLILSRTRPGPGEFRTRDALVGPPLTPSGARVLKEAGVSFAIALIFQTLNIDYRLHHIALEAAWTAKYAGLDDEEAIQLVSSNVEDILGLPKSTDVVLWEGNPLQFGGTVALTLSAANDGLLRLSGCWPQEDD
ncbi:hypothetical protein AURDEDRAFT_83286 [Auricularia subglabra TFB-10046 SS5]|nr:hypothetical protein AURDEDRAFT_83286 [Auricularia subglabra TFB-10046 SS5]